MSEAALYPAHPPRGDLRPAQGELLRFAGKIPVVCTIRCATSHCPAACTPGNIFDFNEVGLATGDFVPE